MVVGSSRPRSMLSLGRRRTSANTFRFSVLSSRVLGNEAADELARSEIAIEQTVNICRLNAKSTLVKSILASTTFSDPKDVIAKLIVEQTNEANERQVLAIQTRPNNFGNFSRSSNINRFNNRNRFNNNLSNRGNSHRRNDNSSRGFGNYRNSYNNNRGNGHLNRRSNRYNNTSANANARPLHLNGEDPQQRMLGDAN